MQFCRCSSCSRSLAEHYSHYGPPKRLSIGCNLMSKVFSMSCVHLCMIGLSRVHLCMTGLPRVHLRMIALSRVHPRTIGLSLVSGGKSSINSFQNTVMLNMAKVFQLLDNDDWRASCLQRKVLQYVSIFTLTDPWYF